MARSVIVQPDTSPLGAVYYSDSLAGIAPMVVLGTLDGSGVLVPVSPTAGIPVTLATGGEIAVVGSTAAGSPVADAPVQMGLAAYAPDTPPAAVDAGDVVRASGDLSGRQFFYQSTTLDDVNDSITNKPKWRTQATVFPFFNDGGVLPTLKALASAALIISTEYDNTANLYQFMNFELYVRGAVAFTSGSTVDYWIIPSVDGTNYGDGSASVTPARPPDGYFAVRAVTTQQRTAPLGNNPVMVPNCKFKILIRNSGGQAFTNVNGENTLVAYAH